MEAALRANFTRSPVCKPTREKVPRLSGTQEPNAPAGESGYTPRVKCTRQKLLQFHGAETQLELGLAEEIIYGFR